MINDFIMIQKSGTKISKKPLALENIQKEKPEETIFCLVYQKSDCEKKLLCFKSWRKVIHSEGTKKILYQQPS